ncbi:39S ribosomal protein L23, mitochondrial [Contarinia nasturtii]|uniref:39S ribosomal protein L23, mitochondrial n=1 Tax=Contarinia nasturtii TaxID=265458 RepID=UPI0012D4849F|nr:39S ribosomal protein L23, mitochondrial [Contarinia nasturtii]
MSTRWYPIYKRGNPQLRVFMPNFWMKMVRNDQKPTPPANVVTFHCSMEMTKHDIKNYLTKIYNVPVVDVRTEVRLGEFFRDPINKYVKKKDDYRVAIVTMPAEQTFEFPTIHDEEKTEEEMNKAKKSIREQADLLKKFIKRNENSRNSPPFFSI